MPQVVNLKTLTNKGVYIGSGVFISTRGHILTAGHVADGAHIMVAEFGENRVVVNILGVSRKYDLALGRLSNWPRPTVPARLSDKNVPDVGEQVIVIGNPLGLKNTVTVGTVSAYSRGKERFLQFDAAVNGGNSGGPLFDSKGRLIGIHVGKMRNSEGLGLAVPIDQVKEFIKEYTLD